MSVEMESDVVSNDRELVGNDDLNDTECLRGFSEDSEGIDDSKGTGSSGGKMRTCNVEVDGGGEGSPRAVFGESRGSNDEEMVEDGDGGIGNSKGAKMGFVNVEGSGLRESGLSYVFGESRGLVDEKKVGDGEVGPSGVDVGSNACSLVDDSVSDMGKDSCSNMITLEGSVAQQLFPKPTDGEGFNGEVKAGGNDKLLPYAERIIDGNVADVSDSDGKDNLVMECEVETALSNEEADGVNGSEEGFSISKEVNMVVELDVCVRKDGIICKKKTGFCVSDLVWAKVRSHPWWPGQIVEPGDASDEARKHFRSKSYLVAYFGDQTFAWNDEANLKPFVQHFSQMVKQTGKETFRHALDCALDEVSRRVEFGLSCRCIADDVYGRLKTQIIENAGIRKPSSTREGGDRFLTASSFDPAKFLEFVKNLALGSLVEVDRLEHVIVQGQMLSLYRWKGCYHLAEFRPLIGYISNEADSPFPINRGKDEICKMSDDGTVPSQGTIKEQSSGSRKRKNLSGDSSCSTKKVKCLSGLLVKTKSNLSKKDFEKETERKPVGKFSSSVKGGKVVKLLHNDSKTEGSSPKSQGSTGIASKALKPSFSIGESILRIAGQLSRPSPLLKHDVSSSGKTSKSNDSGKQSRRRTKVVRAECSSSEILSELRHAAAEPLKDCHSLSSKVSLISDFHNSVALDCDLSQKHEASVEKDVDMSEERHAESKPFEIAEWCSSGSKSKEKVSDTEMTTLSDFGDLKNAHCTDKVSSVAVQQTLSIEVNGTAAAPEPLNGAGDFSGPLELGSTASGSEPPNGSESDLLERVNYDEKLLQEDSPTALTLKFADLDSIPSKAKLNKIFGLFGPLKESETEISKKKNCVRVVFKRRSDAEAAFSSSGKFETFGPSLVCYRLNYTPSPCKFPSVASKRRKKNRRPISLCCRRGI